MWAKPMIQTIISAAAIFIAITYPAFFLYKRKKWQEVIVLFTALFLTAFIELFDMLAIIQFQQMLFWKKLAVVAEGCLPFTWLLFSVTYGRENGIRSISLLQKIVLLLSLLFIASPIILPAGAFFFSPDFQLEKVLFLENWGFAFYIVLTVYLTIALINLENTLANASRTAKWSLKYEVLGAGSILGALILYYSQGLLYRTINMSLAPVRPMAMIV